MDLPLLLQQHSANRGGIVLCPCDVLLALLERPAWGVHGLQSDSARDMLAGLHQLQETGGRDESPTWTKLAPMDRDGGAPTGRSGNDRAPPQRGSDASPARHRQWQR
jgi:hypothetical protein